MRMNKAEFLGALMARTSRSGNATKFWELATQVYTDTYWKIYESGNMPKTLQAEIEGEYRRLVGKEILA